MPASGKPGDTFGRVAEAYARTRPPYSRAAIERAAHELGLTSESSVLDLAAGTGKLTRVLRAAGLDVVPVEPLPAMRERVPGALDGTAEAIPLEDASVDGATIGDAWHWFDQARAGAELARVVRPGGVVAILWQGPSGEETPAWAQRATELIHNLRGESGEHPGFTPVEHRTVPFTYTTDREGYLAFVSSMSYVASAEPARREQLLTDLDAVVPDRVEIPYATQAFLSRRRG